MCYIMGGATLHSIKESLPPQLKNKVSIEGIPCLGYCNEPDTEDQHPCVLINGNVVKNASNPKIISQLLSQSEQ